MTQVFYDKASYNLKLATRGQFMIPKPGTQSDPITSEIDLGSSLSNYGVSEYH